MRLKIGDDDGHDASAPASAVVLLGVLVDDVEKRGFVGSVLTPKRLVSFCLMEDHSLTALDTVTLSDRNTKVSMSRPLVWRGLSLSSKRLPFMDCRDVFMVLGDAYASLANYNTRRQYENAEATSKIMILWSKLLVESAM